MENQRSFSFCANCGQYLRPDQGRSILRDSGPVVLCDGCLGKENEREVMAFERKYQLTPCNVQG